LIRVIARETGLSFDVRPDVRGLIPIIELGYGLRMNSRYVFDAVVNESRDGHLIEVDLGQIQDAARTTAHTLVSERLTSFKKAFFELVKTKEDFESFREAVLALDTTERLG
jgi:hypothetical protein